jgi:hypothetical protein
MNNFIVNSIIVFAFSVLAFYGYTVYVLFYAWPVNEYDHGYWSNYQGHAKWSNLIKLEDIINKPPKGGFFTCISLCISFLQQIVKGLLLKHLIF